MGPKNSQRRNRKLEPDTQEWSEEGVIFPEEISRPCGPGNPFSLDKTQNTRTQIQDSIHMFKACA